MKSVLFSIIISFFTITINAQKGFFYKISFENQSEKKALDYYKDKIREIVSYKLQTSKYLKLYLINESFNSKKDGIYFMMTYWLQDNGKISPYLFAGQNHTFHFP